MKNLRDQFSDEEQNHLNYLGSRLRRPNTPEEQELENISEAVEKEKQQTPEQDVPNLDQARRDEDPNNAERSN
jgi:hypothetical protein